jgi:hypothetical protein
MVRLRPWLRRLCSDLVAAPLLCLCSNGSRCVLQAARSCSDSCVQQFAHHRFLCRSVRCHAPAPAISAFIPYCGASALLPCLFALSLTSHRSRQCICSSAFTCLVALLVLEPCSLSFVWMSCSSSLVCTGYARQNRNLASRVPISAVGESLCVWLVRLHDVRAIVQPFAVLADVILHRARSVLPVFVA